MYIMYLCYTSIQDMQLGVQNGNEFANYLIGLQGLSLKTGAFKCVCLDMFRPTRHQQSPERRYTMLSILTFIRFLPTQKGFESMGLLHALGLEIIRFEAHIWDKKS